MGELFVAGISGSGLSESISRLLVDHGRTVVCSAAMYELVRQQGFLGGEQTWVPITPLDACLAEIGARLDSGDVVVLTSGDPLFFGIGQRLLETFEAMPIRFLPAVSYMQTCFARFNIPWHDAHCISLHGRPLDLLDGALCHEKLFVYTDRNNSPDRIAAHLLNLLGESARKKCRMFVGVRLETKDEQLVGGTPETIAALSFAEPNCLIVTFTGERERQPAFRFGLGETDIGHSRGLITKNEIRAAALHLLRVPVRGVFWDVGAGSGAVGLEAARLAPSLSVFAIERATEQQVHIVANRDRFECRNLRLVAGEAPEALSGLPAPDRVFVGGSGGRLAEILATAADALRPGGIVVVAAVLQQTAAVAPEILYKHGYRIDMSRVEVTRRSYPNGGEKELNPITLIRGSRIA